MATEKAQLNAQYKYLKEQLTARNLTKAVKVVYTTTKSLNHPSNEGGDWEFNETKELQLHGNPNYKSQIEELQKCFTESEVQEIKSLAGTDFNIECKVGDTLPEFKPVLKVFEEGTAKIEHNGEVLLIDVWATWCGPCQKPMSHNQEMLEKNEAKWGKNVRIVGVSVDEELDELKKRITEKKWTKVEHYYLGGWDEGHDLIQNFKIRGIPFVVLIDKSRKIVFTGHPASINLEEKINELLEAPIIEQTQENTQEKKSQSTKIYTNQSDFKKFKKYLKSYGTNGILNQIKGINEIKFSITKEKILENGEDKTNYGACDVFYEIQPINEKNLNQVLSDLKSNFEENLLTYSRKHIIDPKRELKEQIDWVLKTTQDLPNFSLTEEKKRVFSKKNSRKDVSYQQLEPLRNSDIDEKTQKKLNENFEKQFEEYQNMNYDLTFTEDLFYTGIQTCLISEQFIPFSKIKGVYLRDEADNLLQNTLGKPLLILFMSDDPKRIIEFAKKQETDPTLAAIDVVGFQLRNVLSNNTINELKNQNVKIPIYAPIESYTCVPELQKYQLRSADFSIGVNKFGKVCLQGAFSIRKNAKIMTTYEKQTEEVYLERKTTSTEEAKMNYKAMKAFLKTESYTNLIRQINEENATLNFKFIVTLTKVRNLKNQIIRYKKPILEVSIRETAKSKVEELVQELSKFNIKKNITYSQVVKIQKAKECSNCKKEIQTDSPQYYNHFKTEFYCLDCGDAENEGQKGLEKYKIKDNLVLIKSDNPDYLTFDAERLGKNLQPSSDEQISQSHSFSCNGGCRKAPKDTERWICLTCRPGLTPSDGYEDFCTSCKNKVETIIMNAQELEEVIKNQKHYNAHSLLRIRYNHGYYRF